MNTVIAIASLIFICFLVGLPVVFLLRRRKIKPYRKPVLEDFPRDRGELTNLSFEEWCRRNRKPISKRRTNRDLWNFCYETGRPTLEDWKEIHGYGRSEWVADRAVYENWLKHIGAYNSKFDPSSPDYDGGDASFEQRD